MNKKRALLSVTDKTGIVEFAKELKSLGWDIISTGGTAKELAKGGVPCDFLVEELTGFPEMLDGRVKTLHPKVFAGVLADRRNPAHLKTIEEHGIRSIDLVCVNLYDFKGNPDIEQIDIGGPSLLRAAAKNGASVIVVPSPVLYGLIIRTLKDSGDLGSLSRQRLVMQVFETTARYDAMIGRWMEEQYDLQKDFLLPAGGSSH